MYWATAVLPPTCWHVSFSTSGLTLPVSATSARRSEKHIGKHTYVAQGEENTTSCILFRSGTFQPPKEADVSRCRQPHDWARSGPPVAFTGLGIETASYGSWCREDGLAACACLLQTAPNARHLSAAAVAYFLAVCGPELGWKNEG